MEGGIEETNADRSFTDMEGDLFVSVLLFSLHFMRISF